MLSSAHLSDFWASSTDCGSDISFDDPLQMCEEHIFIASVKAFELLRDTIQILQILISSIVGLNSFSNSFPSKLYSSHAVLFKVFDSEIHILFDVDEINVIFFF